MKVRERKVSDWVEEYQSRGTHDKWVEEQFPKYWKKIVVQPEEATRMMSYGKGEAAKGEVQGIPHYHLIYPPTVGSLTIRMGYMELPVGLTARKKGFLHYHMGEEIFYVLSGKGAIDVETEEGIVERFHYEVGDGIFVPFGVKHGQVNLGDEPVCQIFAIGPRLRPYDDITETAIDYREFEE